MRISPFSAHTRHTFVQENVSVCDGKLLRKEVSLNKK